jgi:hypothetical protein
MMKTKKERERKKMIPTIRVEASRTRPIVILLKSERPKHKRMHAQLRTDYSSSSSDICSMRTARSALAMLLPSIRSALSSGEAQLLRRDDSNDAARASYGVSASVKGVSASVKGVSASVEGFRVGRSVLAMLLSSIRSALASGEAPLLNSDDSINAVGSFGVSASENGVSASVEACGCTV